MYLPPKSSPHTTNKSSTQNLMLRVILATLPAFLVSSYFFGIGPAINVALCIIFAVSIEAFIVSLRKRPVSYALKDGSVIVTAVLLGLALPPFSSWWLVLIAIGFAVIFGKHLFGGLGQNPFNPAMLGYVVVLVSFPVAMTSWPAPQTVASSDALAHVFLGTPWLDAWSHATVLDTLKNNHSLTLHELWQDYPYSGWISSNSSEWINLAFLLGGLYLLYKRVFTWHAPVAMLLALALMSLIFWNGSGSASNGSPLFHLFSGATMLGAFFIITDPVSSATSNQGRFIFGLGVGVLVYIIRAWGGYPDAIAFSVLLMNLCAPTIDYFTRPRTYGQRKAKRGFNPGDN
ncbi:RnfABCDGE type electron transport complex subunit D [Thiopseudomonas acetoxidans]|uniref:Ion-translocating oxidoreductase complex subunit D n=1 Tax=Thiopseudomonas acetoxidans TaxID=3041622 RepID=A0ABT7SSQ1_9GAMM|nr:RnfABCDGE type electron transport complex subunit D [Thiopseudomonas sp. CY1220]MDM7858569.1 RnfABCDGE type electron transport complex subunit D [Thiopseudomonas sp. CY1220]NLC10488.1 RnfABCDGE type electron transport complex subunit D [Gammaproteobacteria bacterium]